MDPGRMGTIVAVGLACYAQRALPQFVRADRLVRGRMAAWLQYASLASIGALGSSIAFPLGEGDPHLALWPRVSAIALTIAVAAATRRSLPAIAAGLALFVLLRGLG